MLLPESKHEHSKSTETDNHYRRLLGDVKWQNLKPEIRQRFSRKFKNDEQHTYNGTMVVRFSFFGWLFAQVCRVIGKPLATQRGEAVPVSVTLSYDRRTEGTQWKRHYFFTETPEVIVSAKAVNQAGGLEEHVGFGFSMCLDLLEVNGNLEFHSSKYYWTKGSIRLRLPSIITPGRIVVKHEQVEGDFFRFSLEVNHPILGQTIYQSGVFS